MKFPTSCEQSLQRELFLTQSFKGMGHEHTVVSGALGVPSDDLDAMVELGAAVLGDDSAGVCLPCDGIDADGEGRLNGGDYNLNEE